MWCCFSTGHGHVVSVQTTDGGIRFSGPRSMQAFATCTARVEAFSLQKRCAVVARGIGLFGTIHLSFYIRLYK